MINPDDTHDKLLQNIDIAVGNVFKVPPQIYTVPDRYSSNTDNNPNSSYPSSQDKEQLINNPPPIR